MPILNFNTNSTGIEEIDTSNAILVEQNHTVNTDNSYTVTKVYRGFHPIEFSEKLEPTYNYLNGTEKMYSLNTKQCHAKQRKVVNSISELNIE